jgi:hypothetical protein
MQYLPENLRIPDDQNHTSLSINIRRRFDQQVSVALVAAKSSN